MTHPDKTVTKGEKENMETIFTTKQVQEIIMGSMIKQFETVGNGWDSPIKKIVAEVIDENREVMKKHFQYALNECFSDKEFMSIVRQEFKHKVAKNMVGKLEGEVEKAVNTLRQDPTMKSRMILAIERIIKSSEDSNEQN